jgi:hypothetical protein
MGELWPREDDGEPCEDCGRRRPSVESRGPDRSRRCMACQARREGLDWEVNGE